MTVSECLRDALLNIEGVEEGDSMYKDAPALWVNGKEIVHFEDEHAVDVRLTREVIRARRAELRADPRITLRRSSSSDWVEVEIRAADDEGLVLELVEQAAAVHRAAAGTIPKPPPAGAELAHRQRFH